MKNLLLFIAASIIAFSGFAGGDSLVNFVNPFVGTGGHGHTYPGATMPFGMVQLSPDSRLTGWDGCSGYHYSDSVIYGFSHTHLSGTGVSDYGDVLLMPVTGRPFFNNGSEDRHDGYASLFSHDEEEASPGYYAVNLKDYNVDVELTATLRCGFHKYQFPCEDENHVVLDLAHRDKVLMSEINIINDSTISGKRISKAWASEQHVYFYAVFSEPFKQHKFNKEGKSNTISGDNVKAIFSFGKTTEVKVKVGISPVDIAGAKKNLEHEIPHWNFDKTRQQAEAAWEKELNKVEVSGGTEEQKITFYTALYHAFLSPDLYNDVDGRYRGRDLKVHQLEKGEEYYTVFSLWDTFRAAHPLFTILQKGKTRHFINTMLLQYEQGGRLPVWELSANETDCMIGYHSVPVIADAFVKGINEFDHDLALEAMVNSGREDRYGLDAYKKLGYIPSSEEGESVSKTLEYAYDDWCIAMMAGEMGEKEIENEFMQRAQYWKNMYDPQTKFMRAKVHADWFAPFDPAEVNFHYTEANAWQYNFFVPQDVNTMIDWMGGTEKFDTFLTRLFTESSETTGRHQADITGLIGQYAHGNEPSHHMAYLYNFAGKPWKTQQRVREIMDKMYSPYPDGLSGNEDCGQMSAWYVLSAMGFYPVTPGTSDYIIGSPLFDEVTLNLENGNRFSVKAKNQGSKNVYISKAEKDGKSYGKAWLTHDDIDRGSSFVFYMSENPGKEAFTEFPQREITTHQIVAVPFIKDGDRTFKQQTSVEIGCADSDADIFYKIINQDEKNTFVRYSGPIRLGKSAEIAFFSTNGADSSAVVTTAFTRMNAKRSIKLLSEYANQYAASGHDALIDGLKGGDNFKTGTWQGYQGQDVVAAVDLGGSEKVNLVKVGFLQDSRSWILLPEKVKVFVSMNGKDFNEVETQSHHIPKREEKPLVKRFAFEIDEKVRFIKVVATSPGKLPEWHLGAGGKSWIFVDEIEIE